VLFHIWIETEKQVLNYELSAVGILAAHTICTKQVCIRQSFALALGLFIKSKGQSKTLPDNNLYT